MPGNRVIGEDPGWSVVPAEPGRLYESARWIPEASTFQWVDILRASLHRWRPGEEESQARTLDLEFVTMALPLDAERSLVTSRNSLHEYDWSTGTLRHLGAWKFAPDVRFNDGGISPSGDVYLGTMSMERRSNGGALYNWQHGDLITVVPEVGISNGLGWAKDGTAYYVDSLQPRINRLDESGFGLASPLADLDQLDEPDGLTVTPEGEVLVALWGGARLARFAADGRRLADLVVPAHFPTSVAFNDERLLVTTALVDEADGTSDRDGCVLWSKRMG